MYGWNESPRKLTPRHLVGGENPGRAYEIGNYLVTVPNDPEKDVTAFHRYNHSTDPKHALPNMAIESEEIRIPITDLVATILTRLEPADLAQALWSDQETRDRFMDHLANSYDDFGEADQRNFLQKIKERVHSSVLQKVNDLLVSIEHKFGKKWWFYDEINRINDYLHHADIKDARGEPLRMRHEDHDPQFKIGGTNWDEAQGHWRREIMALFPGPTEADEIVAAPVEQYYEPVPCACGVCSHWHVTDVAEVQGVSFTEEQAVAVADMLNKMRAGA